jgi:hypothetical protein
MFLLYLIRCTLNLWNSTPLGKCSRFFLYEKGIIAGIFAEVELLLLGCFNIGAFGQADFSAGRDNDCRCAGNRALLLAKTAAVAFVLNDNRPPEAVFPLKHNRVVRALFVADKAQAILRPDEAAVFVDIGCTEFGMLLFIKREFAQGIGGAHGSA